MPAIKGQEPFEVWMQFMTVKQKRHWPFNLSSSKTRFMAFKGNLPDWKVKEIFNNIQSMLMGEMIWYLKAWDVNNLLHCNSVGVNTVAASKRDTFTHRICFSSILCRRSHVFFFMLRAVIFTNCKPQLFNPFTPVNATGTYRFYCLTPENFTFQWGTPRGWKG